MERFTALEALITVLVSLAAVTVGYLLGRRGHRELGKEAERLNSEVARAEAQSRDQSRLVAKMRNEQRGLASLFRALPDSARNLNRSDLDPQEIPRYLFQLAEAIFEPQQMLLFLVRSPGEDGEKVQELYLRDQRGLPDLPSQAMRIRIGEGKIGWVAENKIEMLADDWLNLSRTEGRSLEDNHPAFRLDLIGPLVHHDEAREELIGVLCIGEPGIRPRDEKLMLQMITNLVSIAYKSARNVRVLREQAAHDGLTGLLNKRQFMVDLGVLINRAERRAQPLGLFMFDIDHFKSYNDSHGHLAGDEVLKRVARVIRESLRPGDLACRYGGEEFLVTMPLTDGPATFQAAERIREAIATHPFAHGSAQPGGRLTISGGVAAFPVDGTIGTDLIRHADQALYQAKAAGRNRVILYKGVDFGDSGDEAGEANFAVRPLGLADGRASR